MFKNREVRVKLHKIDKDAQTPTDNKTFEKKVGIIFHQLESIGVKVFVGVCVYVLLDTYRQIEVEKIKHQ